MEGVTGHTCQAAGATYTTGVIDAPAAFRPSRAYKRTDAKQIQQKNTPQLNSRMRIGFKKAVLRSGQKKSQEWPKMVRKRH